ncbi:hypothetical protein QW131_32255 [Roseibium salinum]|nr:hypothetical protein [Roseibium salinum]
MCHLLHGHQTVGHGCLVDVARGKGRAFHGNQIDIRAAAVFQHHVDSRRPDAGRRGGRDGVARHKPGSRCALHQV